jgi:DNA-binding response OmpR family regulator
MNRILIIDDEEEVREELKDRVASMGHESEEAASQAEALRKLDELDFDLVLLDLTIPLKFEGVARVDHGKNLLERIVSQIGAPPVIVITAHEFDGHMFAIDIIDLGATTFVAKPFDENPVEPKIRMVLEKNQTRRRAAGQQPAEFKGGSLVLNDDGIELCGQVVGGTRGHGYIRRILEMLAGHKNGQYVKLSRDQLAEGIGGDAIAAGMASAISDFRTNCAEKLGCGRNDVIRTEAGGGYRLAENIEVKLGREERPLAQIEEDKAFVIRQIKRHGKRTRRQISDVGGITAVRVKAALSALDDEGKVTMTGSGSSATYSLVEGA